MATPRSSFKLWGRWLPGLTSSPGFLFCLPLPCGLVLVLCAPVAVSVSALALSPSGWCPHVEEAVYNLTMLQTRGEGVGSGETARLDHSAHPSTPSLRAYQASVLFG